MRRFGVFVLLAAVAAGGCAAPAKYVERKTDGGVVGVPDDSDGWPSYNRREALKLIEKDVGPNYEIVEERRVVTGQTTLGNQQTTTTEHALNAKNAARPAQVQTTTGTATQQDVTQWQITYRKKAAGFAPRDLRSQEDAGPTPDVRPAGGPISAFNRPAPPATGAADCNH